MILDNVIDFYKLYKLIVALRLKSSRDLDYYLKAIIKYIDDKSLLNFRTNYKNYNVYDIYKRLNLFNLSYES